MEIKTHFRNEKKFRIRKGIKPGNNKTLWEAVKLAKDLNIVDLPDQMNLDGTPIPNEDLAEAFAKMFEKSIHQIELQSGKKSDSKPLQILEQ